MKLFWGVPSHVYKTCCKDLGKCTYFRFSSHVVLCVNDPTFRLSFFNPFADSKEITNNDSFFDIISYLQSNCLHGSTPIAEGVHNNSFQYQLPEQLKSTFDLD